MTRTRTARALAIFLGLLLAGGAMLTLTSCQGGGKPGATKQVVRYHCPMHPSYISDRPGDCPICGMKLVPMEVEEASSAPAGKPAAGAGAPVVTAAPKKKIMYRSTMSPNEVSDKPGKDSMGMEMERVEVEEGATTSAPQGYADVKVTPERIQMMGVTTAPVKVIDLERTVRAVGSVSFDETRLHHIHAKFDGYIVELFVDSVGKFVHKGDPLITIYSPELVATQEEYLLAVRAKQRLGGSTLPGVARSGEDLLDAARQRLLLWDIAPDEIARIERAGRPLKALTLRSPVAGYVVQKTAVQGNKVMSADTLYDIADLSTVWVLAAIYEYELPFVKVGQKAEMVLAYLPGRTWEGRVDYVYPTVDEKTRTVQVRIEFPNSDETLKPGMYANVLLKGDLGKALAVPDSAVIATGERKIAFVDKGEGKFEPREVTTGAHVQGSYEVLGGLSEGESVVTAANFLIDSESKLKAAIAGMTSGGDHQHGK